MHFKVAAVFSDNMVLQQGKRVCIFGEAGDGIRVNVSYLGYNAEGVSADGHFRVYLPPMEATKLPEGGSSEVMSCGSDMVITASFTDGRENASGAGCENSGADSAEESGRKIVFKNVVVGEVWLAGGQSNMEYELQNMIGGKDILNAENDLQDSGRRYSPFVRFYYTQKKGFIDEEFLQSEEKTCWNTFSAENAKCWSAVGFLYARQLAEKLGVIVGVVGCNWGGTSASAWLDRESMLSDEDTRIYIDEYDEKTAGKTLSEMEKEYKEYEVEIAEWDRQAAKIWSEKPSLSWEEMQNILGPNRHPGPMGVYNPMRPTGLYECMLKRIMPYTLRGFIYYQGESDDHRPEVYYKLFTMLIRKWREYFEDEGLAFLHVQLPMHRYPADPDKKNWCIIREAQMKAYLDNAADGIAVGIDSGEFNEIHPKDKRNVSDRLARQALYKVYNVLPEREAFGPIFSRAESVEAGADSNSENAVGSLVLTFDHAEEGFIVRAVNPSEDERAHETDIINNDGIIGFEIAGKDGVYYPAVVSFTDLKDNIKGSGTAVSCSSEAVKNTIILSSDKVKEPVSARYLWTNYGTVSIFGKDTGIPLAPFRF